MKKSLLTLITCFTLFSTFFQTGWASANEPTRDSEELRLQDMLMNMLTPYIREELQKYYYPKIIKDFGPQVSPWNIEVIETRRVNGFRGLLLEITFEIEPDDGGHHVRIGKDRMTYLVTYGPTVKLIRHTHLKTYKYPRLQEPSFDFNKLPRLFQYVLSNHLAKY